jgi:polyhydroxyalkanoate synthesis regulator phasin
MLENGNITNEESKAFSASQLQLLISMIQAKYNTENPKISSALKGVELSKANMIVKKKISVLESECATLKKRLDVHQIEIERKNAEIESLVNELQLTKENKRGITKLEKPSEELISSSIGFSMLLEQLINALAELEEQGLQLGQSNELVEDYTVLFN